MSENNLSIGATDEGFDDEDASNRPKLSRSTGDDADASGGQASARSETANPQSQISGGSSMSEQADMPAQGSPPRTGRRSALADAYEFERREQAVQEEFSPVRITPEITTDSNKLPHKYRRQVPVKSGTVQLSACVRPEVASAVTDAQRETSDYFADETVLELDFHDAVYCVALQHLDEVAAVMAKTGYGRKD